MNTGPLSKLASQLRELPKTISITVAAKAAPTFTELARRSFDSGTSPDGVPWAPGANGQRVTLVKTGELRREIAYEAVGPELRIELDAPYAKYVIGKRPVLPGKVLPEEYVEALTDTVGTVAENALK